MSNVIHIRNIIRNFQLGSETVYVLKGIDLDIERGDYVAIMGPSGSGKSTLMNLLGCLDTPTAGTYILNDQDVSQLSDDQLAEIRNKEIGFVFQTFNLLPRTTALDNVALPMIYAGASKKERVARAEEVLTDVGLADRMDHRPNELSGGQRQRVAVGRALVNKPSIILADEPTGNLDFDTAKQIYQLLQTLNRTVNTSFVIVTHDLTLAAKMDRQLRLEHGHLKPLADTSPSNLEQVQNEQRQAEES